jgi:hypothetical protein
MQRCSHLAPADLQVEERVATFSSTSKAHAPAMEPSFDPGTEPVLGEGHYTVLLAGGGDRTLEVTRAGPDFGAGPFASYLCRLDNERDYPAFARITSPATAGSGVVSGTTRPSPGPPWPIPRQPVSAGRAASWLMPPLRSMRRCREV